MIKKILFVDDEADLLLVSLLRLKKTGYEVFGAVDGQEALDLASRKMPDMILMDVYLPDIEGDEVARILKKNEKTKLIPVLLISATSQSLEERAQACGAAGYLSKPFAPRDLLAMIEKHTA